MNITELRQKNIGELTQDLAELLREQFKYRMAVAGGEFTQTHLLKQVRKNIARVNTVISEFQMKKVVSDE